MLRRVKFIILKNTHKMRVKVKIIIIQKIQRE